MFYVRMNRDASKKRILIPESVFVCFQLWCFRCLSGPSFLLLHKSVKCTTNLKCTKLTELMLGRVAQIENVYRFWLEPPNVFLIQGLGRRLRRSAAHAHGLWKIADCYYGSASGQGTKLRYYLGNGAPRHCGSPQCPLHTPYTPDLQISRLPDFQISTFSFPDFYIFISIFHLPSWVLAGGAAVKGFFLGAC